MVKCEVLKGIHIDDANTATGTRRCLKGAIISLDIETATEFEAIGAVKVHYDKNPE